MTEADYLLLDVFTDIRYRGNQLAVVVDPPEMSDRDMQVVAAEFNLSETAFVRSPGVLGGAWPTRIFTPGTELPFAGHPTVGSAVALAELGLVEGSCVLAEGVGDVEVTLDVAGGVTSATLRSPRLPEHVDVADPEVVVGVLGLGLDDLEPGRGPSGWSCGVPFAVVPLRDLDALARCRVDEQRWAAEMCGHGADHLYPIVIGDDAASVRARMFAPAMGITEDPATGAAAAAVTGHLLARSAEHGPFTWTIEQGIEMGRPSRLDVEVVVEAGELRRVHLGGPAVVVARGTLTLP